MPSNPHDIPVDPPLPKSIMPHSDTALELPWKRQRLRVPREDHTLFAVPSLRDASDLIGKNHADLEQSRTNIQGRSLTHLRGWTRDAACNAAREYTSELIGQTLPETPFDVIAVAGHQPALFHTGVWVKNFAIGELASHSNGLGLNLVVDNDTFSNTHVRVPVGDRNHPAVDRIPFDVERPTQPWENAEILDRSVFEQFGDRAVTAMRHWNIEPLAMDFWKDAVAHADRTLSLVDCLTAARNRLERRWGLNNLELPISRLCGLDPFLWFASHLLAHLPRFRDIHNQVLIEYRQINRIRSRTHPVPDLKSTDGWQEAPFWMWRAGDLERKRVLAKQNQREVWLSDGVDVFAKLPLTQDMDACCAVEVLRELPARGIHLRTRALTTTLFARLCLGDLFVHGIGGAKYDEMTDRIIARFFGLNPPAFSTMSASLHLPLAKPHDAEPRDAIRLRSMLRDLRFNSQRHLTGNADPVAAALVTEKSELIAEQDAAHSDGESRSHRRRRHRTNFGRFRRLQQISQQLAQATASQRARIEEGLQATQHLLAANAILKDREFAFCLYPEQRLHDFMAGIWQMQ